jgi:hypothetical protein
VDLAQARQATGVILSEPGFAYEKEEGEPAVRFDGEKVLSPERVFDEKREVLSVCH